jgi:NAD(P)-dependent dehydrogenase (short-subunit alcohol dehydrogenase family)
MPSRDGGGRLTSQVATCPERLRGRTIIVTGAGSGIGAAAAARVAAEGAYVVVADVNRDAVFRTAAQIGAAGGTALAIACDVADEHQVEALVESALASSPRIDALVSSAGVSLQATVAETDPADWDRVLAINLKGPYLCARAFIPHMAQAGGGAIVNVASVVGYFVEPGIGAYCASKGGLIALTRAIAIENGRAGIRCNCICPGYVDTPLVRAYFDGTADPAAASAAAANMHALRRIGEPSEIASVAAFLCSDDASFCTGQLFIADGGLSAGFSIG